MLNVNINKIGNVKYKSIIIVQPAHDIGGGGWEGREERRGTLTLC